MKKIHKRYFSFVFALIMSALMSGMMCFLITAYQLGFTSNLFSKFLETWSFAFPFALITAQVMTPIVRKITTLIVDL